MNMHKPSLVVIALVCALACTISYLSPTWAQEEAEETPEWAEAPVLRPLGRVLAELLHEPEVLRPWEWVLWPSQSYLDAHPPVDRTGEFPPIYLNPEHEAMGLKEDRGGAVSPDVVRDNAMRYSRAVVEPKSQEQIDKPTEGDVLLLQLPNPADSKAYVRVATEECEVRITYTFRGMCVVLIPTAEFAEGVADAELGPAVFSAFLTNGDRLAEQPAAEVPGVAEGLRVFLPLEPRPKDEEYWRYAWDLWYTDGRNVAVFFRKFRGWEQRVIDADEPWF